MDGIAKEWGFASRSSYNRDIPAMESFSDIGNQFTRTDNQKLRQEMTVKKLNFTMESLNFHLFEIVQQALL